jgi:hypothetical protein
MRKDEIEDRIIRLEQDVSTLKTAHREGVEAIIAEIRLFQDSVIAEKMNSVRAQLDERYERMIAGLLVEVAEKNLSDAPREPCNRNHRAECDKFYLSRILSAANLPLPPGTGNLDGMEESDEELVNKREFLTQPPCSTCFGNYRKEKQQLESVLGGLSRHRIDHEGRPKGFFLADLPNDEVLTTILEPLAHKKRFVMLKSLSNGSRTFKELSDLTSTKGGHLVYHITLLLDAGLIIKTDAGKRYSISDRGLNMMDLVKKMYSP